MLHNILKLVITHQRLAYIANTCHHCILAFSKEIKSDSQTSNTTFDSTLLATASLIHTNPQKPEPKTSDPHAKNYDASIHIPRCLPVAQGRCFLHTAI